eukprot:CAMPEP_0194274718 /NCGR_PEP_ID=MMETSP0169-20130528/7732_1 /TAXON_ID=218684 /ORGANISM="Corethron pennatum, Strain L29A3" /LENGTH=72 /DNA_ID=CAMNT_0039017989 /DNA_START=90 /DNA_END=308 /DNA_ORIENTATION=-
MTDYDDDDWDELPPNVQAAAAVLGYTKAMWDGDKHPASEDKDHADLSQAEKDAAKTLGYTAETWDADSSDSE